MKYTVPNIEHVLTICTFALSAFFACNSHAQLKTSGMANVQAAAGFDHLIQDQPLRTISVSIRFFDEVEASDLKAALFRSNISAENFRFVNGDTNGEVRAVDGGTLDSSFDRLKESESRLLDVQIDILKKRLHSVNATSQQKHETSYMIRRAEWQKQELTRNGSKIIGIEVRGSANLVKEFCEKNAFVKAANITPSGKR